MRVFVFIRVIRGFKNKGDNISLREACSPLPLGEGGGRGFLLIHHIRADSLQREAFGDVLFELYLGAEDDAVATDEGRGREVVALHGFLVVALALDADVERAEVVEHHTLAAKQSLGDEGFDTCQHGHDVTFGTGGGEGDVVGEVLERVVASLHCGTLEVIHFGILGVRTF